MRALLVLPLLASCTSTRACKSNTVLVTLSFEGDSAKATSVAVSVRVGTSSARSQDYPRTAGPTSTLEVIFPNGYPAGQSFSVDVSATLGGIEVGHGGAMVTLQSGCTPLPLTVMPANAGVDLAGADLASTSTDLALKKIGDPCSPGDNCGAGFCVDGYCCSTACTDQCAACDVAGKEGTCSAVGGAPHGSHLPCTGAGGACGGSCDGIGTAACVYPGGACPPQASCMNGVGQLAGMCQMGICDAPQVACADQLCGDTACQTVARVTTGFNWGCALLSDATLRCWGGNAKGQLGLGAADAMTHPPTPVPGMTGILEIAGGGDHMCALMPDHTLRCWGQNDDGELGLGVADANPHPMPTPVCDTGTGATCVPLANVKHVGANYHHTCAVVNANVKCWGDNYYGQLGDGTSMNVRLNPVFVCESSGCTNPLGTSGGFPDELALGVYHTCAFFSSSNWVMCWGNNGDGECGQPSATQAYSLPQLINGIDVGLQKAIHIAATNYTACAIVSDGNPANNLVRCWGSSGAGERGDATYGTGPTPSSVCLQQGCGTLLTGVTAIAGGYYTLCSVANGAVYCWGKNGSGQFGDGTVTTDSDIAVPSLLTTGVIDIGRGDSTFCARLQSGGTLRCWGWGGEGACGDGSAVNSPSPTPIPQAW